MKEKVDVDVELSYTNEWLPKLGDLVRNWMWCEKELDVSISGPITGFSTIRNPCHGYDHLF